MDRIQQKTMRDFPENTSFALLVSFALVESFHVPTNVKMDPQIFKQVVLLGIGLYIFQQLQRLVPDNKALHGS